jgi:GNAT superfamily N-acetyltransferase
VNLTISQSALTFARYNADEVKAAQQMCAKQVRESELSRQEISRELRYCGDFRLHMFRGAEAFALLDEQGNVLSLNATRFSQRRKMAWGLYINCWLTYTPYNLRGRGYASKLYRHIEALARSNGYHRMKTLASSWAGFRLHWRLGHVFWGLTSHGDLIMDNPLDESMKFPDGIPMGIRTHHPKGVMAEDELVQALTDPAGHFARDPREVYELLRRGR